MKTPRSRTVRLAALALVTTVLGALFATPAQAAAAQAKSTASCVVFLTSCNTNAIPANAGGHYVLLEVWAGGSGSGCSWRIRDVNSWAVVMNSRVGAFAYGKFQQFGLYGWYRAELYNCRTNAVASIFN